MYLTLSNSCQESSHYSTIQEKLKEKESRKTQTFKKDDDKKKKLMQVEVQVGQAFMSTLTGKFQAV